MSHCKFSFISVTKIMLALLLVNQIATFDVSAEETKCNLCNLCDSAFSNGTSNTLESNPSTEWAPISLIYKIREENRGIRLSLFGQPPVSVRPKSEPIESTWEPGTSSVFGLFPFVTTDLETEAKTVACVLDNRKLTGIYQDNEAGYQPYWLVKVYTLSGKLLASKTFAGGLPPDSKYGNGPEIGDFPTQNFTEWLIDPLYDKTILRHADSVRSVAFSPTGKILASLSNHQVPALKTSDWNTQHSFLTLWNLENGKEMRKFDIENGSDNGLAFSIDGKILATIKNSSVILLNVGTGKIYNLSDHTDRVISIALSPDGKTLASGSSDKTVKLWNVETGQEIRTLGSHSDFVRSIAFSPDGKTLASGSNDKTVKLWNVETGQEIRTLGGHTDSVISTAFSPDGKTLASGSYDKTVKLWNVETGQEVNTLSGHTDEVESLVFSPDGKTLASRSQHTAKLWNITAIKEYNSDILAHMLNFLGIRRETSDAAIPILNGTEWIYSIAFSPDGKILATGMDKTVKLWNMETRQELHTLSGHTDEVISLAFSPDGKILASGSKDKTVKLWAL
jgi:WD40 repeat protein